MEAYESVLSLFADMLSSDCRMRATKKGIAFLSAQGIEAIPCDASTVGIKDISVMFDREFFVTVENAVMISAMAKGSTYKEAVAFSSNFLKNKKIEVQVQPLLYHNRSKNSTL